MSDKEIAQRKIKEIFDTTLDVDEKYTGNLSDLDYYGLLCKSASKDRLFKLLGNNVCMFNYQYNGCDSVLMLFSIPMNAKDVGGKHVSERVMDIVESVEECFTTVDYSNTREVKEDKFIYMVIIKKIEKEN